MIGELCAFVRGLPTDMVNLGALLCLIVANYMTHIILGMLMLIACAFSTGGALIDAGESMKRLAEVKDALDIDVKQNFIDPLQGIAEKDIKDIQVDSKDSVHTGLGIH